jgi:demethylmenaquinone methyltransferase/2-methoxy-6-polyprenyl-1,4-benzoquinol methylase
VLPNPEEKAGYVRQSFGRIAAGYDRVNRVMTFGMDQAWRAFVTHKVAPLASGRALDVGTGTGDFLPLLAAWVPDGVAVGVDFSLPMMQAGRDKLAAPPDAAERLPPGAALFVGGDALQLPFADNSFDAITTAFVLRNVTDIDAALREMWRVARPGAAMACLDVARPHNPLLRIAHRAYFEYVVPWIGYVLNGERRFYTYLPHSARAFPAPAALAQMMQAAGWCHVSYSFLALGAVAVHVGHKR